MAYQLGPSFDEDEIVIVQKGDTATRSIDAGSFVLWNGKVRKAKAAILQGTELSSSLFDGCPDGALN